MTRTLSVYLDLCRFSAAMAVVLSHVNLRWMDTGGMLWQAARIGPEAVPVFFVLSGFVIAYVTSQREPTAGVYFLNRAARLYSVLLPTVLVILVLDMFSMAADPRFFLQFANARTPLIWTVPATLLFVNEAWSAGLHVGSDDPLWSLSLEAAYYVAYGAALFGPFWVRSLGPLAVAAVMGPKAVLMAPLWLLGILIYHLSRRTAVLRWGPVAFIAGWACLIAYQYGAEWTGFGAAGPAVRIGLAQDYLVAISFALTVLGAASDPAPLRHLLARVSRPVRWLAGASFTLYVLHCPVLAAIGAQIGHDRRHSYLGAGLMLFGAVAASLVVAEFSERRKAWFQQGISRGVTCLARLADSRRMPRSSLT